MYFILNITISLTAEDYNKFDKLSKDHAKCTSGLLKDKTSEKIKEGKKI